MPPKMVPVSGNSPISRIANIVESRGVTNMKLVTSPIWVAIERAFVQSRNPMAEGNIPMNRTASKEESGAVEISSIAWGRKTKNMRQEAVMVYTVD